MKTDTEKTKVWTWLVAIAVFLLLCWLAANWEDFKEGLTGGYRAQTESR